MPMPFMMSSPFAAPQDLTTTTTTTNTHHARCRHINVATTTFIEGRMANMRRGFKEVHVANLSRQQRLQRFPRVDTLDDGSDGDYDESDFLEPSIALWRLNLVALSQRENVYFTAYQDKVHVTIPRGLKQTLSGKPDLILNLPRSPEAVRVGGFIEPARPHCVNHLITGNLGTHEIILLACDDGDVIAYYVHTIAALIKSRGLSRLEAAVVKPFFHENVGASAWGLAIHEKSRLIAASSNLREVTLFIPAYSRDGDQQGMVNTSGTLFPDFSHLPGPISARNSNGRKILKLGPDGHNIPSISFASSINGEAESILAADIHGNLWILEIWSNVRTRVPGMHKRADWEEAMMAWGVLVLPLDSFRQTSSPHEAFGILKGDLEEILSYEELGNGFSRSFDISSSINDLKDPPRARVSISSFENIALHASSALNPIDDNDDGGVGDQSSRVEQQTQRGIRTNQSTDLPSSLNLIDERTMGSDKFRHFVSMNPNLLTMIRSEEAPDTAAGEADRKVVPEKGAAPYDFILSDKSAILRTYQSDVELIPPTRSSLPTICKSPLKEEDNWEMQAPLGRLSLHAMIPQLSLVIIGAQSGKIALITITRPVDEFSAHGPVVTFRIDRFLPEENQERTPLLGMAISPLQMDNAAGVRGWGFPRKWRLLLHYWNHTVLCFELSRDQTDSLIVL